MPGKIVRELVAGNSFQVIIPCGLCDDPVGGKWPAWLGQLDGLLVGVTSTGCAEEKPSIHRKAVRAVELLSADSSE